MMQTSSESRYRWTILGVLWIAYIVVYLNRLSVGPLAPFLKDDLGLDSAGIGLIVSAAAIGYSLANFPVGWLVDKIGARWPMAIGEVIAGTGVMLIVWAPSYTWLLVFMFIAGIGCGFLMPATTQGVLVWFPPNERATIMGLKQTSVNLGGIISAAILPVIALSLGWRFGFLFLGLLAILIGIASLFFYREPPVPVTSPILKSPPGGMPIIKLLKNVDIWLVSLSGFCFALIEFAISTHLVLYLKEVLFYSVVVAGGMLALVQGAGIFARPASGVVSDRVFKGGRKIGLMLMAGTATVTALILALAGEHLSWGIYPVLLLLGMGGTAFGGLFLTLIAELGGRQAAGKAAGLSSTIANSGGILGPWIFGLLVDTTKSYQIAWFGVAGVGLLAALLLVFVRESRRQF